MKTFGSSVYVSDVSALLVSTTTSTTTSFFCIRPFKYIQYCKSYFKNQNYVKGQLVSVLWCLWWSLSTYVVLRFSGKVRNCHSFVRSFVRPSVRPSVRSFVRSFVHPSVIRQFLKLTYFETHEIMKFMECYHVAKKKTINRRELNRKQRRLELCGFEVCWSAPEYYWLWMVTKLSNSWNISCVHSLWPNSNFFKYGWISELARWSKSCFLIGYPSRQDRPNLHAWDFPRWSRKRKFSL